MISPTNKRVVIINNINIIMNYNLNLQRIAINRRMAISRTAQLHVIQCDAAVWFEAGVRIVSFNNILHWMVTTSGSVIPGRGFPRGRPSCRHYIAPRYSMNSTRRRRHVTFGPQWSLFHRRRSLDETRVVYVEHTLISRWLQPRISNNSNKTTCVIENTSRALGGCEFFTTKSYGSFPRTLFINDDVIVGQLI